MIVMTLKHSNASPLRALLLMALLGTGTAHAGQEDSLYQQLGERPGITRIVEGMLLNAAHDNRIVRHFRHINPQFVRDRLVLQLCAESGGPCVYDGEKMSESHKGMNIDNTEFDALLENLTLSMQAQKVPTSAQSQVLTAMQAQRGEVVGK